MDQGPLLGVPGIATRTILTCGEDLRGPSGQASLQFLPARPPKRTTSGLVGLKRTRSQTEDCPTAVAKSGERLGPRDFFCRNVWVLEWKRRERL